LEGAAAGEVFVLPIRACDHPIRTNGHGCSGRRRPRRARARRGTLPAQAQVAAWVRPARALLWAVGWFYRLGRKSKRIKISFSFPVIANFWKMDNRSKKI